MAIVLAVLIVLLSGTGSWAEIYKYVADDGSIYFTNTPTGKKHKVYVKENHPRKTALIRNNDVHLSKESFHGIAEEKARLHNLDPNLVKAVIKAESNWDPSAVSPKGALGLMQLMPSTAFDMGVANPFNPEENIEGGTRYLKLLLQRFNWDIPLALAAYNAGPERVEKINSVPAIPETRQYVKTVMNNYYNKPDSLSGFASNSGFGTGRIKKILLKDGTLLFTNSYSVRQEL
jgi:hypothetical protein